MRLTTLAQLRTRTRVKADVVGHTGRHPDSEVDQAINIAWRKLHGKLALAHLLKSTKTQVVTASGATFYTLPDDFLHMYGVWHELGNGAHRELKMHNPGAHPFGRPAVKAPANSYGIHERDDEHFLEFLPQPNSGTYVYVYVPEAKTLTAATDEIAGAGPYDEYVVLDAAVQLIGEKDGLPVGHLKERLLFLEQEIESTAQNRDLLQSTHIRDIRGNRFYDAADASPWGDWRKKFRWF